MEEIICCVCCLLCILVLGIPAVSAGAYLLNENVGGSVGYYAGIGLVGTGAFLLLIGIILVVIACRVTGQKKRQQRVIVVQQSPAGQTVPMAQQPAAPSSGPSMSPMVHQPTAPMGNPAASSVNMDAPPPYTDPAYNPYYMSPTSAPHTYETIPPAPHMSAPSPGFTKY